jgi:hypothetical protein
LCNKISNGFKNQWSFFSPRIDWQRESQSAQKDQHCGVYCLRTSIPDWSEEQLGTTYTMLTEIEATFRCLKIDLGLRPVYHQKEEPNR